jgi:hypothetical protein
VLAARSAGRSYGWIAGVRSAALALGVIVTQAQSETSSAVK